MSDSLSDGTGIAEIILFPTHKDYCISCIHSGMFGNCLNAEYHNHARMVNCVWGYCPYRKEKEGWQESLSKFRKG